MTVDEFNTQYKNGDILVVGEEWVLIFYGIGEGQYPFEDRHTILYHAVAHIHNGSIYEKIPPGPGIGWVEDESNSKVRYATNSEIDIILRRLASYGFKWDSENLTLSL